MTLAAVLADWPGRRWLVTAVSTPLLVLAQLNSAPAGAPPSPAGWVATTMTAALAGLVLASYVPVPGSGRLPHVGCTPCAAVAGFLAVFAVLGSLGSVSTGSALFALALTTAAAYQRLTDAGSCPTPAATMTARRADAPGADAFPAPEEAREPSR